MAKNWVSTCRIGNHGEGGRGVRLEDSGLALAVVVTIVVNSEVGGEPLVLICRVEVSIVGVETVDADADAGDRGCWRHERMCDGFAVGTCGGVESEDGTEAGIAVRRVLGKGAREVRL